MTVAPTDLASYLGVDASEIDDDRATLLITQVTNLASTIVSPLPDAADAVILSAAARAYVNPVSTTAQMVGPYQMSGVTGGAYLTKAERATLRRLAGGGGAFSIDLVGINGAFDATDYPQNRFPDTT